MQNSLTKKLGLTVAAVAMAATGLFTATDAEAVPAFARQTGMTCNSCHFQAFPALNGMGRSFRNGGYTMPGAQTLIEGENMSLPDALNIGAIWKTLFHLTPGEDAVAGEVQAPGELAWPDESALLVGGRASASVGFLWELGLNESPNFLSTKIHFNVTDGETAFAVIPFATDAAGVGYGQEGMNTAVQKSQRVIEARKAMSTGQITGSAYGEATGIALVLTSSNLMVNFSRWAPAVANEGANVELGEMFNYLRVNYFMDLAGFDTGFGLGVTTGSANFYAAGDGTDAADVVCVGWDAAGTCTSVSQLDITGGSLTEYTADVTVLDFQMQGQVGGNDLGIYFNMTTAGEKNFMNFGSSESGFGLTVKYSVTPKLQVFFATSSGTVTTAGTAESIGHTAIGAQYHVAENVKLQLYNESDSATDAGPSQTIVGWFVAL